jgi:DNA-directed RNA polymerase subunit RPC12/RpoP
MAVYREFVFTPADTRVSMQCDSCKGETVFSLKGENLPKDCPSCGSKLLEDAVKSVQQVRRALRAAVYSAVMLRVYETVLVPEAKGD